MDEHHEHAPYSDTKPPRKTRFFFVAYLLLFGVIIGVLLTNTFSPTIRRNEPVRSPETSAYDTQRETQQPADALSPTGTFPGYPLPEVTAEMLTEYERVAIDAVRSVIPAVVSIYTSGKQYYPNRDPIFNLFYGMQPQQIGAMGSGVIIDPDGTIITNEHVISSILDAEEVEIKVELPDGRSYNARVERALFNHDIAILKIDGQDLPYLEISGSTDLVQGQTVLAIGNPFGFSSGGQPTVTRGVVSATRRNLQIQAETGYKYLRDMIQTDASINEGNSGGALIDLSGRLVGINTAIFTPSGTGSIGIGFAIPSSQVRSVIESLEKYGDDSSIRSGISIQTLTQNVVAALGFDGQGGVLVSEIEADSPGERDGFRRGDIITEINGFSVISVGQTQDFFRGAYPGEVFEMTIFRDGDYQTLTLVLGSEE